MPYVPSKKTDGKSTDRELIDQAVKKLAKTLACKITNNFSLIATYKDMFLRIARHTGPGFYWSTQKDNKGLQPVDGYVGYSWGGLASAQQEYVQTENDDLEYLDDVYSLAMTVSTVGKKYGYEGAFLGELNYAITRLIQCVPQLMVEQGKWKDEIRYWLYAATVEALTWTAYETKDFGVGISGVFEDVKDEYKRRVNPSYETAQILKSGDCYDTPYYNRLVEVRDDQGNHIGHLLVDVARSVDTLNKDCLDGYLVLHK